MSGFVENWEGILLGDEAADLMSRVSHIRAEIAALSRVYSLQRTNEIVQADADIQRRKRELEDIAADLQERCEWQIALRRHAMADETFIYSEDPETDRYGDIEAQADQIEKIEYALVRTKTAQDMLKSVR